MIQGENIFAELDAVEASGVSHARPETSDAATAAAATTVQNQSFYRTNG
jgi:hypothetical protein